MNILVLQSELGVLRGGGENFTRNLFSAFAERGHRISAAFVADRRNRYPFPLPSALQPLPVSGWWSSNLGQATLSSIGRYLPAEGRYRQEWDRIQQAISWRIFRWHRRRFQQRIEASFSKRWEDFDVVYVHGNMPLASRVAGRRPTVLRLPGPVTAEVEGELRSIHAVCANGDALSKIRSFLGEHVEELVPGVNEKLFKPDESSIRPRLGWTHQDRVVGYVGRLTHLKGVDLLAAAFREIAKDSPKVKLIIVGSGEEERNIRSDLTKELSRGIVHLESDVTHEHLPEWYRAMDLLIMPSRYENFSNAILEAMACGISFLAADVGGNRIMAEAGGGWLFECRSASSLVTRLKEILKNSSELKARGKIGFDYVQNHHSWSATAEQLEKIIVARLGVKR